ncbi:MAG: hypothetical protein P4N59_29065 [Negativicutes bacterium]|nr:hypothetical protein [Negativicutes bacterium]
MERICPICNSLKPITARCSGCGGKMEDAGKLTDYRGPYSPYMDAALFNDCGPDELCVHLLTCPDCGHDIRAAWKLVVI